MIAPELIRDTADKAWSLVELRARCERDERRDRARMRELRILLARTPPRRGDREVHEVRANALRELAWLESELRQLEDTQQGIAVELAGTLAGALPPIGENRP